MSAVRTLPIRVPPLPGEAIDSWLEAIAHRTQTAWDDLLAAVALHLPNNSVNRWVIQLTADEAAAIGTATGVAPSTVHAMTLSHYANRPSRSIPPPGGFSARFRGAGPAARGTAHTAWPRTGGRWQLAWRLGWAFACLQHQCLLADICPACGGAQRHRTHVGTAIPNPGHCANPVTGPTGAPIRCGADLTATAVTRLERRSPGHDRTTNRLRRDRHRHSRIRRLPSIHPSPGTPALADIRAVAGRILAYATPDELERVVPPIS